MASTVPPSTTEGKTKEPSIDLTNTKQENHVGATWEGGGGAIGGGVSQGEGSTSSGATTLQNTATINASQEGIPMVNP